MSQIYNLHHQKGWRKQGHMVETYGTFPQISGFKRNYCEKDIHVKRAIWYLETYVTETYGGTFPQVSDCKRNYFEKDIHMFPRGLHV